MAAHLKLINKKAFLCTFPPDSSKHAYEVWLQDLWASAGACMDTDERSRQLNAYSQLVPRVHPNGRRRARVQPQEATAQQRRDAFEFISTAMDEAAEEPNQLIPSVLGMNNCQSYERHN